MSVGFTRHDEEGVSRWKGLVKVGELTSPMVGCYISRIVNHLDPGGNINKKPGMVWSIR